MKLKLTKRIQGSILRSTPLEELFGKEYPEYKLMEYVDIIGRERDKLVDILRLKGIELDEETIKESRANRSLAPKNLATKYKFDLILKELKDINKKLEN